MFSCTHFNVLSTSECQKKCKKRNKTEYDPNVHICLGFRSENAEKSNDKCKPDCIAYEMHELGSNSVVLKQRECKCLICILICIADAEHRVRDRIRHEFAAGRSGRAAAESGGQAERGAGAAGASAGGADTLHGAAQRADGAATQLPAPGHGSGDDECARCDRRDQRGHVRVQHRLLVVLAAAPARKHVQLADSTASFAQRAQRAQHNSPAPLAGEPGAASGLE